MPSITIVLPVYNGIEFLELSVISVLKQKYSDFEFLIIDDNSSDGSWEYLQTLSDKRITLYRNEKNKGLFYNLNFLINISKTPIIKLWSQDDIMYPICIEEVIFFHNKYPDIGFSYSDRHYINDLNELLKNNLTDNTPELISTALHAKIAFFTGSIAGNIANVAISKSVLDEVGPFNESMIISGDFEMWVRLARNHKVGFLKKPLVQLRNHKGQLSGQEQYYIYHLREDIEAYKILFNYISLAQKVEGKKILREKKILFYYTLMLKAFFKGKFKLGYNFLQLLGYFDNIFLITWCYFKYRILFIKVKQHI